MKTIGDRLVDTLTRLGLTHVFGVPGTQTVELFECFRHSSLRTVLAAHELNAAFMAVGYFRASGRPAVLSTISGPGFTHALSGVIEARHDSAALLHVAPRPSAEPGIRFGLQAVSQSAIAGLETKGVYEIEPNARLEATLRQAFAQSVGGEPGPVLLHVPRDLGSAGEPAEDQGAAHESADAIDAAVLADVSRRVQGARRPVLLVGQGALRDADAVQRLAESLGAPVATSCSARGIVPEDHPLNLGFDALRSSVDVLNEMLASADCILVLGYKLTYNGTAGFKLVLRPDALVHVDSDPAVVGAHYPVARAVIGDAATVARQLAAATGRNGRASRWTEGEIDSWRVRLGSAPTDDTPEPRIHGTSRVAPHRFFRLLREALPRNAIVVTDSGLHQVMVRRHLSVLAPRGLIVPSDYQSMGFGIPAAIGASIAAPERPVVAVVGDGGVAMTGMELLTAVRERTPLVVVVFNDGYLNLIRMQQYSAAGRESAVRLHNPDFELMAHAVGATYRRFDDPSSLDGLFGPHGSGVTLVEVCLEDSAEITQHRYKGYLRTNVRRALGPRLTNWLKRRLRGARAEDA